jgi:hypothetical protein
LQHQTSGHQANDDQEKAQASSDSSEKVQNELSNNAAPEAQL